ncbi:hypothetical protein [Lysinibacillus sp. 3P01SB]|uniref:hypothetical protein n=1 Tax=Lysinibacillus sp. 3P01SB TaxID=3132284 RepID=UPI0039A45E13
MVNQKKLEMAFRRYKNNYVDDIYYKDVKEKYTVSASKIKNIAECNSIEKDHILLINLNKILSYQLSLWKNQVLMKEGKSIEHLKSMQVITFYQCVIQNLYKNRYPKMMVEYSFREVIATLIHFTMYGWVKEENILFEFIVDHFGSRWMDADNWNKHTWFLLEIYLQYRNKTIMGTNQNLHRTVREQFKEAELEYSLIPEDLDVYTEVLERWTTAPLEEIKELIERMSSFHSILASELGESIEFGDYRYGFYPYEILFLIYVRQKRGLPVPQQFDDFLMNTPEAQMVIQDPEPYPEWDPLLRLIDNFYRKNYPEYIPNDHGALFQGTENLGGEIE